MAKYNDMMADEMFPEGDVGIHVPGEKMPRKKGGALPWIAAGLAGLGLMGYVGYKTLGGNGVTPDEHPTEPIVDTRPVPKPEIPEGPTIRTMRYVDEIIIPAQDQDKPDCTKRIPPKPGLKPYLGGLAWVDDNGWVYPNEVDKTPDGSLNYIDGDIKSMIASYIEKENEETKKWRNITKYKIVNFINDNNPHLKMPHRYVNVTASYEGNFGDSLGKVWEGEMIFTFKKVDGEWKEKTVQTF